MFKRLAIFRKFSSIEPQVLNEIKNDVFFCRLNHPASKNALSKTMITEIQNSLNSIQTNPSLRAAVFCSNVRKTFCTGANLKVS